MSIEVQAAVEQLDLHRHLSQRTLAQLISVARVVEWPAATFLFREGQQHDGVYLLVSGKLELAMTIPGRGRQRILTVGPGELVAWSSVLGEGRMTCDAQCMTDARLLRLTSGELSALAAADPLFGYEFIKLMAAGLAKRLTATRLQMLDLFSAGESR
jgi:CRP/FNR family transcriptional regulator, cyclic AMP receptor protein